MAEPEEKRDNKRIEHVVSELRHVGHRRPRLARCARRHEAGTPAHLVGYVGQRAFFERENKKIGECGRRGAGAIPSARRFVGI